MSNIEAFMLGVLPTGNFDYQHTADTRQTSDIYRPDLWLWPESPNDVHYLFVVETPVIILAHAAMMSGLGNVYIEGYAIGIQDPVMPFQKFENAGHIAAMLPKGLYRIISEGTLNNGVITNGNITTFISAIPSKVQYNFGDFAAHFSKEICGDTQRASNAYGNPSRNDIHYNFKLMRPMDVSVSMNNTISGIGANDANLYLLNQSGNELFSS